MTAQAHDDETAYEMLDDEPGPVDPGTGWRRWWRCAEAPGGSVADDVAAGTVYVTSYEKPGTAWRAEEAFYPVETHDADGPEGYGVAVTTRTYRSDEQGNVSDETVRHDRFGFPDSYASLPDAEHRAAQESERDASASFAVSRVTDHGPDAPEEKRYTIDAGGGAPTPVSEETAQEILVDLSRTVGLGTPFGEPGDAQGGLSL